MNRLTGVNPLQLLCGLYPLWQAEQAEFLIEHALAFRE